MVPAIVSGALANKPFNGGNAWTRLSWVSGLRKLGFDVYFVEEIARENCLDSAGAVTAFENSVNLAFFRAVTGAFDLSRSSTLIYAGGEKVHGVSLDKLARVAEQAGLLFNISGHLTHPELKEPIALRIYYDDDPGFTQFWHAAGNAGPRLDGHHFYFTIGENIGAAGCLIPSGGIDWRHTRPPVVLEEWPVCAQKNFDRFTTVGSWRGAYGPVQYQGRTYGLKVHEFRKFIGLPGRSGQRYEIALQIHPSDEKDLNALRSHGWEIKDPKAAAASSDAFRKYIQTSGAEFSVAQ